MEITGKRTAYSAHGTVVSLNGAPEGNVAVGAIAVRDAASSTGSAEPDDQHHLEETVEAVTEADGTYRLRGLRPGSRYDVHVKKNAFVDGAAPAAVPVHMVSGDRRGLDFVVFRAPSISQIAGAVDAAPEWLPYLTGMSRDARLSRSPLFSTFTSPASLQLARLRVVVPTHARLPPGGVHRAGGRVSTRPGGLPHPWDATS